ncbi:protein of unknown function DUF1963, partial [Kipferlia bialata]
LAQMPEEVQETLRLGDEGLIQVYMCYNNEGECESWEAFSGAHCVRFVEEDEMEEARTREDVTHLYTLPTVNEDGEEVEHAEPFRECPISRVVRFTQDYPKSEELSQALDCHPELGEEEREAIHEHAWERRQSPSSGLYIGGWFNWCQGIEYPDCPECGQTMNGTVLNIESLDSEGQIGLMFGDCGTAEICQCPTHERQMTMVWACC